MDAYMEHINEFNELLNQKGNYNINQDEHLTQINDAIPYINVNGRKNEPNKNDTKEEKSTTKTTKFYRNYYKGKRIPYGRFLSYKPKKKIPQPINPFLKENMEFYKMTYYHFSEKVPHFISQKAIELKKDIIDFGQKLINSSIIRDDINNLQLVYIDYKKFCTNLTKDFNEKYLDRTLEELFIEFQAGVKGFSDDHNKEVINYIRSNRYKELFANEYLDLNFWELVEKFNEIKLDEYLQEKKKELTKAYEKHNNESEDEKIINIDERTHAYETIIKTLCYKFREYSTSFQARNKKKLKK